MVRERPSKDTWGGKQEVMAGLEERTSGGTGGGQGPPPNRVTDRCGKLEIQRNHRGFLKLGNFSHLVALLSPDPKIRGVFFMGLISLSSGSFIESIQYSGADFNRIVIAIDPTQGA